MIRKLRKPGFTIIELMLAMTFISVLLLAIATTAIQIGKIYNRGLILSSLNTVGRDISDVLRRDFLQTDRRKISVGESGGAIIQLRDGGNIYSGRFCLGDYSYLWNTAETLDAFTKGTLSASNKAVVRSSSGDIVNFIRVADSDGSLCRIQADGRYKTEIDESNKVTHLAKRQSGKEVVLAVHDIQVRPVVEANERPDGLYHLTFTLGTSSLSEINTVDKSCKPSGDDQSNAEFCAINQFNMIVRTNG